MLSTDKHETVVLATTIVSLLVAIDVLISSPGIVLVNVIMVLSEQSGKLVVVLQKQTMMGSAGLWRRVCQCY